MADEIADAILENAQGPVQARGDRGSVRQHSLRDQIEAERYLAGKDALGDRTRKTFGVRMGLLIPPGAV